MPTVRETRYTNYSKLACSLPSIPNYVKGVEFQKRSRHFNRANNSTEQLFNQNGKTEGLTTPKIDRKYLDIKNSDHGNLVGKIEKNDLLDFKLPTLNAPPKVRKRISERREYCIHPFPKLGSGHGIYIYENKFFRYEGQWRNGLKHGQGKLHMSDGSLYSGQFMNGEIDGQGYRYFAHTRDEYNGDFRKGEMHGKGRMTYSDGSVYDGQWYRNRKHGYGIMRMSGAESETYEGGYLGDLKDGYGRMFYRNGDQYEGYWKNDVRVGRGVLKFSDGSLYDGEFIGDVFHGRGLMRHISGITYNGEWINGFPLHMSTKIVIVLDLPEKKKKKEKEVEDSEKKDKMIIRQGVPFRIRIECRNEKDELVEDEGRELRLTAGYRYYPPVKENESPLFDIIEDMEEKPVETPFGYSVVPYPITDQLNVNTEEVEDLEVDNDELMKSQTDVQGDDIPQEADEREENVEGGEEKTDAEKEGEEEEGSGDENNEIVQTEEQEATPSVPLPPPVPNKRTAKGECVWEDLHLAPAPPGYRPFKAKEEFERAETMKRSRSKAEIITPTPTFNPRRNSKTIACNSRSGSTMFDKFRTNKRKALEEKYAKTGEYVLMVHDVTDPPYLDRSLAPAFLLLKLKQPEVDKKKDSRSKWSTEEHIRQSMRATETSAS